MTKISITLFGQKPKPAPDPFARYVVVYPDYTQHWPEDENPKFNYHVSRPTRNSVPYFATSGTALPATATFQNDKNVPFTCELQEWVHAMNCRRAGYSPVAKDALISFHSMFRGDAFITNRAGTDQLQDCINNQHIGAGWPMVQPMACGGSVMRENGSTRKAGADCWLVDAINPDDNPTQYDYKTHPYLFFFPTQSARIWRNKDHVRLEDVPDNGDKNPIYKEEYYEEPLWFYNYQCVMPIFGYIRNENSKTKWSAAIPKWRTYPLFGEPENPFLMRSGKVIPNPYL